MIRAIIFDCFGVLTADQWRVFCAQLPETADIDAARELNRAIDRGYISKQQYMDGIFEATGSYPPDIDAADYQFVKDEAVLGYIAELKNAHKIGLLSNISNDWITERLLSESEQQLFDAMVFSYQVGLAKPNPEIFQTVCDQLSVQPHEAVMIDDVDSYIEGARAIGMQGIVFSDLAQLKRELVPLLNANK